MSVSMTVCFTPPMASQRCTNVEVGEELGLTRVGFAQVSKMKRFRELEDQGDG